MSILSQGPWFDFDPSASRQEGTNLFIRQWLWSNHTRLLQWCKAFARAPCFPVTHYINSFLIAATREPWWFEWEMVPIGSGIWTLGPQSAELRLWGGALAGSTSLGVGLESLKSHPTSNLLSVPVQLLADWRGDLLASRSCFKLPYLHPQWTPILLEPNAKINSFISYSWSWGFITAIDKQLRRKRSGGKAHSWSKQGHSPSRWGSSCVAGLWTTWSHGFQSGSRECTGSWAEQQNLKPLPPSWWTVSLIWPLPPARLNLLKGPKPTQTVTPAGDKCSNM